MIARETFFYLGRPQSVLFGFATLSRLSAEMEALGVSRALVLSTPEQSGLAHRVAGMLGATATGVFTNATMHTPSDVTASALEAARAASADVTIAIGGGSTTGLGKAISLRTKLPQIAIPTTYAGSEMTPILGETENGLKTTKTDPAILPGTVIYDVELTMGLPSRMSAVSGLNAMAHAVEAIYAKDKNPIVSLMAEEGLRALASALPGVKANPWDREARYDALYGAWLCGTCLGSVGMALHHKLCHTLGGSFNLPHAETHAVILPHAIAYNEHAVPDAMARIARAIGSQSAAMGFFDLNRRLDAPLALKDLGMQRDGLEMAIDLTMKNAYWNPGALDADRLRRLLLNAYDGRPPEAR